MNMTQLFLQAPRGKELESDPLKLAIWVFGRIRVYVFFTKDYE
jgi:hypothetical protein